MKRTDPGTPELIEHKSTASLMNGAAQALVVGVAALIVLLNLFLEYEVNDLAVFVSTARALVDGRSPYQVSNSAGEVHFAGQSSPLLNVNPPTSLPLMLPLAPLDPVAALPLWMAGLAAIYIASLVPLFHAYPRRLTPIFIAWSMAFAGVWDAIHLGQIYTGLLAITVAAWLLLRSGHWALAGLPIGLLAAMKPNLLVWPVLLGVAGYWTPALVAGGVALVVAAIPLVLFGVDIYAQWLTLTRQVSGGFDVPANASLPAMMSRLGWAAGFVAAAAVLVGAAAVVFRRRPDALQTSSIALISALLASPIATVGYTVLLLPIFFHARRHWTLMASAAILAVPAFVVWRLAATSPMHGIIFGSIYSVGLLLLLGDVLTARGSEGG